MTVQHRKATHDDLLRLWNKSIENNPNDVRYVRWKEQFISDNEQGRAATFCVCVDGEPVGEGTLLFSPACRAVRGRLALADAQSVANINALRIEKRYEGRGYISALVRLMEQYAREQGYRRLTIGVEQDEKRNRKVYAHLGYTLPVHAAREDGVLVLYYAKHL